MIMIERGTNEDMLKLWNGRFTAYAPAYTKKIDHGQQEIWMAKDTETNQWVGELHLLWEHEDSDLADGKTTAYLLAFRVDPDYQGRGIGKRLMQRVLERVAEREFKNVTVGVEEVDKKVFAMYQKWGFHRKIKDSSFFYEEDGISQICSFGVYQKTLEKSTQRLP